MCDGNDSLGLLLSVFYCVPDVLSRTSSDTVELFLLAHSSILGIAVRRATNSRALPCTQQPLPP